MALWRLVTGPRTGRAPVLAIAVRFPDRVQRRLAKRMHLEHAPIRGALRVSLGHHITLRAFLDFPHRAAAKAFILSMRELTARFARSPVGRALGLRHLLSLLLVHPEGARVVVQWIGRDSRVGALIARLTKLLGSHEKGSGKPEE